MKRPGNIFLLALLIGAISSALLYRYLSEQQAKLEAARGAAAGAVTEVVVATDVIPIGTRLGKEHLKAIHWPSESLPEGTSEKPDDLIGKTARVTIERNSPILATSIVTAETGLLPLLIAEGMRGVSVKVDTVTGVSGFITPNSHVDVVASGSPESNSRDIHSKVILQNVRVLAIGTAIEMKDDKPVEVPAVTLMVTPSEAEKLTLAAQQIPVRLALRNYRDDNQVQTAGAEMASLFGPGRPAPAAASAPHVTAAALPVPAVEVVLGDQVSRYSY